MFADCLVYGREVALAQHCLHVVDVVLDTLEAEVQRCRRGALGIACFGEHGIYCSLLIMLLWER